MDVRRIPATETAMTSVRLLAFHFESELFVVVPRKHIDAADQPFLTGDHFSFMGRQMDLKEYIPIKNSRGGHVYRDANAWASYAPFLREIMSRGYEASASDRADRSNNLESLFCRLPIERIMVVRLYNADTNTYDVSIFVQDIYRSDVTRGMFLRTSSADQDVTDDIVEHFKQYSWNTFRIREVDEYDDDISEFEYDSDDRCERL